MAYKYKWGDGQRRGDFVVHDEATKRIAEKIRLRREAGLLIAQLTALEAEDAALAHVDFCTKLKAEIETKRTRRESLSDKITARIRDVDPAPATTRAYQDEYLSLDHDLRELEKAFSEAQIGGPVEAAPSAHSDRPDGEDVERTVRAGSAIARAKCARGQTPTPDECIALGYARAMGWSS